MRFVNLCYLNSKHNVFLIICRRRFPFFHWNTVTVVTIWVSIFNKITQVITHLAAYIIPFSYKRSPAFCQSFKPEPEIYRMEFSRVIPTRNFNIKLICISRAFDTIFLSLFKICFNCNFNSTNAGRIFIHSFWHIAEFVSCKTGN